MGLRYDEAQIHQAMGQYAGAREHLERAAALFAATGAALDLAHTQAWLQRPAAKP